MTQEGPVPPEDVLDDHLYLCEYRGSETVAPGRDLALWNEGLSEPLRARRDLGRVVHSWIVTDDGVHPTRTDHVTAPGNLVVVPTADAPLEHTVVAEDASPSVRFPNVLLEHSHVVAAAKRTDGAASEISDDERTALLENAHRVVERVNADVEPAFRSRYDAWRSAASPYPQGRDFGYDVPLETEWKRRVIADRTDLSGDQVEVLATAGFPASMRVRVDVEYPDPVAPSGE